MPEAFAPECEVRSCCVGLLGASSVPVGRYPQSGVARQKSSRALAKAAYCGVRPISPLNSTASGNDVDFHLHFRDQETFKGRTCISRTQSRLGLIIILSLLVAECKLASVLTDYLVSVDVTSDGSHTDGQCNLSDTEA